jgi:poly-gamma-glutamate synthesis protein (capsule biosynthesis protein)
MKISFIGDVMLGRLVNEALEKVPPDYIWGNTLPVLLNSDFRICNLECVISDKGSPWTKTPKVFHFRSDSKNIEVLKRGNINAISLANNHSLDFGEEALLETISILDQENILYAGAGKNIIEAEKPAIFTIGDTQFAFFAFTDNELDWEADVNKPGINYIPLDPNDGRATHLFDRIEEIKSSVDFVVISAHWGPNWGYEPLPEQISFAHHLIDLGTDIIFGHSPHVFRGIEIYKNKPILYSAGNFIDDYAVDEIERNDQSFISNIEILDKKIKNLELYSTVIRNFQVRMAEDDEQKEIAGKMIKLCEALGTSAVWNSAKEYLEIPLDQ